MSSLKKVFSCLLKDGSELAEVTTGGRLFHTREADIDIVDDTPPLYTVRCV